MHVLEQRLGDKRVQVRRNEEGGGTQVVDERDVELGQRACIAPSTLRALVDMGARVVQLYDGVPQDIEFAIERAPSHRWRAGGEQYDVPDDESASIRLVQARPITTLYPPQSVPREWRAERGIETSVALSFAAIQGVFTPFTPLNTDLFRSLATAMLRVTGAGGDGARVMHLAGSRIFVDATLVLRDPLGRRLLMRALPLMFPGARRALRQLMRDSRFAARFDPSTTLALLRAARNVALGLVLPGAWRAWRNAAQYAERYEQRLDERARAFSRRCDESRDVSELARAIGEMSVTIWEPVLSGLLGVVPVGGAFLALARLAGTDSARHRDGAPVAGELMDVTRSVYGNVTIQLNEFVWRCAAQIANDDESRRAFLSTAAQAPTFADLPSASELAARYRRDQLPTAAQNSLSQFVERYGARGVNEIDVTQPRYSEDLTPIVQQIQAMLLSANVTADVAPLLDAESDPNGVVQHNVATRHRVDGYVGAVYDALRDGRYGREPSNIAERVLDTVLRFSGYYRLRAAVWRQSAETARHLLGKRESHKFAMVRAMASVRRAVFRVGEPLVRDGVLRSPEQLFALSATDLAAFGERLQRRAPLDSLLDAIHRNEAERAREQRRSAVPTVLCSDGRFFFDEIDADTDDDTDDDNEDDAAGQQREVLRGHGVSSGVCTGRVRVLSAPDVSQLRKGEVLVCRGTDPAWTALFFLASGLVTEVGGAMSHGSVVCREMALPGVVGVRAATTRLRTGQLIRVNGKTGRITILED